MRVNRICILIKLRLPNKMKHENAAITKIWEQQWVWNAFDYKSDIWVQLLKWREQSTNIWRPDAFRRQTTNRYSPSTHPRPRAVVFHLFFLTVTNGHPFPFESNRDPQNKLGKNTSNYIEAAQNYATKLLDTVSYAEWVATSLRRQEVKYEQISIKKQIFRDFK